MARSKLLDLEQQFTFYVSPISLPVSLASGPSKVAAPLRLLSTADAPCSNTHQQAWSCTGAKDFQTSVLTSHAPKTGFRLPQASYHTNQVNVLIHIFCVPTILFTALILAHGIPGASKSLATVPLDLFGRHIDLDLTFPFLWAAGNAAYFILLEPVAGALYAPILITFGHLSNVLYATHHDEAMRIAGYAFVASWIAQFVGHGKFEGRAPALLDSLLQSLVLAVFFVWLEVLFFLGYRPQLFKRLQNKTGIAVAQYRKERAAAQRQNGAKKAT